MVKTFSLSILNMIAVGFSIDGHYYIEGIPFFLVYWVFFLSSRVLNFHHFFILLDSHIALSFILIWYTYIKGFSVVKLTLHFWEKSKLVLVYNPFLPYLIRVASVLLRFYVCMSVYVCVCLCLYFLMMSLYVKTH